MINDVCWLNCASQVRPAETARCCCRSVDGMAFQCSRFDIAVGENCGEDPTIFGYLPLRSEVSGLSA